MYNFHLLIFSYAHVLIYMYIINTMAMWITCVYSVTNTFFCFPCSIHITNHLKTKQFWEREKTSQKPSWLLLVQNSKSSNLNNWYIAFTLYVITMPYINIGVATYIYHPFPLLRNYNDKFLYSSMWSLNSILLLQVCNFFFSENLYKPS